MAQHSVPETASSRRPGFNREVGLIPLTFVSLGSIIGSGWLLGALTAATSAGGASIVSWLLAGMVVVLLALVHAELGASYPLAGGTARWPRLAFGSIGGFTAGWVAWLQAVTIAPIEVEAALSYLDHEWHGLINGDTGALTPTGLGAATALMLTFTIINILGVRWLAESNRIAVLWKTAVPLLTVVVLIAVSFHASNFTAGGGFAPYGAHGVLAALPLGVVFALQGFEQAAQIGGEARDPQRNVPRAVIGSVILGTVLYLGLEIAFVGALNPANLLHGWANPVAKGDFGPYATLATGLGLGWLAVILYIDAFISGWHRPDLCRHLRAAVLRAGPRRLRSPGRQPDQQSRGPVHLDHPGVRRGSDLFSPLPQLEEPGLAGHLGNSDHVRICADHPASPAQS